MEGDGFVGWGLVCCEDLYVGGTVGGIADN